MKGYNLIAVYHYKEPLVLMCRRKKDPYKGLINLVGGKIEPGEKGETAAYRELFEETGITRCQIDLTHFMDFTYHFHDVLIEVYMGKLKAETEVYGDENELFWSELDKDFFRRDIYAGSGNLGHLFEELKFYEREIYN